MSTAAVVGFVSSLIFCIPIIPQLLGLILGIVGIGTTSGRRVRGRGLSIAAVCIAPLVLVGWVGIGAVAYTVATTFVAIQNDVEAVLSADAADLDELAGAIHDDHFSARLKIAVDKGATTAFLGRVADAHGRLKSLAPAAASWTSAPGGGVSHLIGKFTKGDAAVDLTIGFDGLKPEIDNITVGNLPLMPRQ